MLFGPPSVPMTTTSRGWRAVDSWAAGADANDASEASATATTAGASFISSPGLARGRRILPRTSRRGNLNRPFVVVQLRSAR
jgi:hypothetical protein